MTVRAFPRLLRLVGGILLAATTGAIGLAGPASAHTTLKQSDPAANAVVAVLPEVVRLTFSDTPPIVPKVTVRDADGVEVNSSPISPRGNTVLQPVKSAKAGRFTVRWELTSSDGHKTNRSFTFTVTAPSPVASPTVPVVPVAPSGSPSATSAAASSTPGASTTTSVALASDSAAPGGSWGVWALVAAVLVAAGGAAVVFLRRRTGPSS